MTTEEQTIKLAQFVEYVICGDRLIHQQFHKLAILWCECTGDMVLCISYHLLPVGFSVNPALHNKFQVQFICVHVLHRNEPKQDWSSRWRCPSMQLWWREMYDLPGISFGSISNCGTVSSRLRCLISWLCKVWMWGGSRTAVQSWYGCWSWRIVPFILPVIINYSF